MKIAFVGDVMLGRLVNDELREAGPAFPWGDTLPLLGQADVRIGNLECVLSDDGTPWPAKVFHFRSDSKNVQSLKAADFTAVSLANNHVLDFGEGALLDTLSTLDRNRILHAGAGADTDAARRPAIWQHDGTTLGFLAVTDNEPGWAAGPEVPGVHYLPADIADARAVDLVRQVRQVRSRVDLLIVSAHWGPNWGFEVPPEHRGLAHALIDAGADVVFGHSPHIVRGVEVYRNRPILYSAGDFVDDYAVDQFARNDQSFIFVLETRGSVPHLLHLYPTIIIDFHAHLATANAWPIARRMQELSSALGTRSTWFDHENRLEIPLRGGPATA